jgi:sugar phosphate permease
VGTAAQASYSALYAGIAVLAPGLRARFDLSFTEVGVVLASLNIGAVLTLIAWGILADRIGERAVIAAGLIGCSGMLVVAASAGGFWSLTLPLTLAGLLGASVNAASGRAVMHWFSFEQRGVALGIRQTAIPMGGLAAALVLPHLSVRAALLALAGATLAGGLSGGLLIRERRRADDHHMALDTRRGPLRDPRMWRLSSASALLSTAQICLVGFAVLFLHEARGLSTVAAAGVVACVQVVGAAMRVASGHWSDRVGSRLLPLRRVCLALGVAVGITTALTSAPLYLLLPALAVTGGLAMGWNALSFTAAAELAGHSRSGAALGLQQTALSVWAAAAAPAFALVVADTSWRAGFALVALSAFAAHALLAGLRLEERPIRSLAGELDVSG